MLGVPATAAADVLIIDDDPAVRDALCALVELEGACAHAAGDVASARTQLHARTYACALVDKNLPDGSGLELLGELRAAHPAIDVIIITGESDIQSAITALRGGATDFVLKPLDATLVRHRVRAVQEGRRVRDENERLRAELEQEHRSAALRAVAATVAHELASPLSYLTANVNFVLERLRETGGALGRNELQDLVDALGESVEGAQKMRTMVDRLRLLETQHSEAPGPVDVGETVALALDVLRPAVRRAELQVSVEPGAVMTGQRTRVLLLLLDALGAVLAPVGDTTQRLAVSVRTEGEEVKVRLAGTPPVKAWPAFLGHDVEAAGGRIAVSEAEVQLCFPCAERGELAQSA